MELKRVEPLSAAKIMGLMYAGMGLIFGLMFSLMMMIGGGLASQLEADTAFPSFLFGGCSALILPIFYGIIGFIGGAIGAWLYNLMAGWIGGLELTLE